VNLFNQFITDTFVTRNCNPGELKMHEYDDEAEALANEDRARRVRANVARYFAPGDPEAPYDEFEIDSDDGSDEL
jgi:hypothetical protein